MDQLRAMRAFVAVVDAGSFVGAAQSLALSPAAVTRLVAELEDRLGARLLQRTTRRLALTEIGESYLERARRILIDIEEASALAGESARQPRGTLRLLAPPAFAVHQIAKHLPLFHQRYPDLQIELSAPGPVETVDESFDVTIVGTRRALDGEFVARLLAHSEVILCAAPEYLDRRGRPGHPREFTDHDGLVPPVVELQRGLRFQRVDAQGREIESFDVPPRRAVLTTTSIDMNYACALAGLGVAGLPSFVAEDALLEGALERVLPDWRLFSVPIYAAMPSRRHIPARTRVFVDFLIEAFGGRAADPWLSAAGCSTRGLSAA
jgi:DNA-binding transcriptional LysR family regulator